MITTMNITGIPQELERFTGPEDLRHFYRDKGISGLELMLCGAKDIPEQMNPEEVYGIHLRYYPSWLDFWRGNFDALDQEYGTRKDWTMYYGGTTREEFLEGFREELEIARKNHVKYVVFHVTEVTLEESLDYRFRHTDEEVVEAACELINTLLDGQNYDFWFLTENLWWSGFTMTRPEITRQLMDGIHYPRKGIILDTGHLLNTNRSLRTQAEGVAYIHRMLDAHGELCRYIKGMHLNQSLSGAYVDSVIANPPVFTGNYWDRLGQCYPHIYHIDYHHPFTDPGVAPLIRRIHPEFVTFELITSNREEHSERLDAQVQAIQENGGLE